MFGKNHKKLAGSPHLSRGVAAAAIIALVVLCPRPADAGPDDWSREMESCQKAAWESGGDPACPGVIFNACLDETGDESPQGLATCIRGEKNWWVAYLAKARQQMLLYPDNEALFAKAEQQWEAYRDADCAFASSTSAAELVDHTVTLCEMEHTRERGLRLTNYDVGDP